MGKKKVQEGTQTTKTKKPRNNIDLDLLRQHIKVGSNARDIMHDLNISQVGSLRNAVFMLSQMDETFYTVPGLVDETRFKPVLKVGKAGIRIPIEKLPFAKGTSVSYEVTDGENGQMTVIITGPGAIQETMEPAVQE